MNRLARALSILLLAATGCDQRPIDLAPQSADIDWKAVVEVTSRSSVRAVWSAGPADVYIGLDGTDGSGALWHFDGQSWKNVSFDEGLYRVYEIWGSSADDVYVAGASSLWHFNGQFWSKTPVGAYRVTGAGPNDVYAAFNRRVTRFNGAAWDTILTITSSAVRSMWAFPGPELVVGHSDSVSFWNGSAWRSTFLYASAIDLWGTSPADVYAVGRTVGDEAGAWHWNGTSWAQMTLPEGTLPPYAVGGLNTGEVYAVANGGTMLHFNGASWERMDPPTHRTMLDVWGTGSDLYVAGIQGKVLRWDGSVWKHLRDPGPSDVSVVWAESPSRLAVAEREYEYYQIDATYRFEEGQWHEDVIAPGVGVTAFGGTSLNDLHAALSDRRMAYFDGVSWQVREDTLGAAMTDLWTVSSDVVFAVGEEYIYRFNGSKWTLLHQNSTPLSAVWADDDGSAFAVGPRVVLQLDDTEWHSVLAVTYGQFTDVWGWAKDDVYVTDHDGILHFDGHRWESVSPWRRGMDWIIGAAPDDVLTGDSNQFFYFNGTLWQPTNVRSSGYVQDLRSAADGTMMMVLSLPSFSHSDAGARISYRIH